MRNHISGCVLWFAAVALITCTPVVWGAQAAKPETQQFTVLRSDRLVAGSESLSNAEANCSISGAGNSAMMQCRSTGGTVKATYHFNTALVVDAKGMGYVIACRVTLIYTWCKTFAPGIVLNGSIGVGKLAMEDGPKTHDYQVVISQYVGPVAMNQPLSSNALSSPASASSPASSKKAADKQETPFPGGSSSGNSSQAKPPQETRSLEMPSQETRASDQTATCMSASGACVSFTSDPQGADIYVDGKFVGDTPSMLTLTVGSHEIRIEAAGLKPWTRTFEASAGSKITIRAPLEALSPQN